MRRRRSDGERSRNAILHEAAQLATVEGLGGLSIGRLAEAVGMSKSGLFAHFVDTHPGPVRDLAVQVAGEWLGLLETAVRDAQAEGAIDRSEDAEQFAFELDACLLLANAQFVVSREPEPIDRARRALDRRLTAAAPAA